MSPCPGRGQHQEGASFPQRPLTREGTRGSHPHPRRGLVRGQGPALPGLALGGPLDVHWSSRTHSCTHYLWLLWGHPEEGLSSSCKPDILPLWPFLGKAAATALMCCSPGSERVPLLLTPVLCVGSHLSHSRVSVTICVHKASSLLGGSRVWGYEPSPPFSSPWPPRNPSAVLSAPWDARLAE